MQINHLNAITLLVIVPIAALILFWLIKSRAKGKKGAFWKSTYIASWVCVLLSLANVAHSLLFYYWVFQRANYCSPYRPPIKPGGQYAIPNIQASEMRTFFYKMEQFFDVMIPYHQMPMCPPPNGEGNSTEQDKNNSNKKEK